MIRHVVMWKINEQALTDGVSVGDEAERLSGLLRALDGVVPGIVALSSSPNVVAAEGNWDFGLTVDFATQEELDAYQVDPRHQAVVKQIKAVAAARGCVDLTV